MKNSVSVIIEARMTSSRLPGKVLKKINNKEILRIIVERLKFSKKLNKIIVATTTDKKDDQIIKLLKKLNVPYYRGSKENVLSRIINCAKKYKVKHIMRVTSDNPLTDYFLIDEMINYYRKNNIYDYLTNNNFANDKKRKIAYGLDLSLFSLKSLIKVQSLVKKNKIFQEYPTSYYYSKGKKKFKIKNFNHSKKLIIDRDFRLTVDTPQDLIFFKKVFNIYFKTFKKDNYLFLNNLRKILHKNPKLKILNKNVIQFKPVLNY